MSKNTVKHARTCVYNVNYHMVWSVKYRRAVLDQEIETYLKVIFQEIAEEKGFEVAMMEVGEQDHVHAFASAHPKVAPSYIVKMLKGISARKLFLKFPRLRNKLWDGHLWNSSFYMETIGSISEETIRKYMENQKKKGGKSNDEVVQIQDRT
ncbi:IS200/IS605 family transposase [Risungbinella massiliensis]|uniref:IS200/IS605 family transposase n=1 Tax=Risungbinella massiliensis TaxID=1329796 RepID=UPI0009E4EC2E|nr:IS200/IS605 family transposase [Risungbinella massiliensis]